MKRLIFASICLLIVIVLTVWGDRILSRALDAELGPLLTEQLGLPVRLAPIQARILTLRANTAELVMGDPNDPAVVATDVQVSLAWSDLLNREIRLVSASAGDLMVRISKWPSSDNPRPDDYRFLEPWLPKSLQLETGRYVTSSGDSYPVKKAHWRRKSSGAASLAWSEDRAGGEMQLSAQLKSLEDLLRLSPLSLELGLKAQGKDQSAISVQADIKPDESAGYALIAQVQAIGMNAHIEAGNSEAWSLPVHSDTKIDTVEPDKLRALINTYTGSEAVQDLEALLALPVPELSFPEHRGSMTIDEIRFGDETTRDNSFDFETTRNGLQISSLSITGPEGVATGQLDILSNSAGWQLNLSADLTTRHQDQSLAPQFLNADWMWQAGHTQLQGIGGTWGALLYSLAGDITLAGFHRGEVETPVTMHASLDNHPGEFILDHLDIEVGGGRITGSLNLSGTDQHVLTAQATVDQVNLDFLFTDGQQSTSPGVAIPSYLAQFPALELNWKMAIKGLHLPGFSLSDADISLHRTIDYGKLVLNGTGMTSGTLNLQLEARAQSGNPGSDNVTMTMQLEKLDIPRMFQEEAMFDSRSSGKITFQSQGAGMDEIFRAMRGTADLAVDFRSDSNWKRGSTAEERLRFAGNAALVIKGERIVGVEISDLDIDSTQQDITGKVSVVSARSPWFIAELKAEKLDIEGLRALMPESTAAADQTDILKSIRKLGSTRLTLDAQSVLVMKTPLSNLLLETSTAPDSFTLDKLDFTLEGSAFNSKGAIKWQNNQAAFTATASTTDFDMDRFLIDNPDIPHVPVSGSIALKSTGDTFSELLANLTGNVNLAASDTQSGRSANSRRQFAMVIKRIPDGMHANISKLQWGESELAGDLRYTKSSPPLLDLELHHATLSLLPWEQDPSKPGKDQDDSQKSTLLGSAAETSAGAVEKVFSAPSRLLTGPGEAAPGEKFFSSDPLPFDSLNNINVKFKGQGVAVTGTKHIIKDLEINGSVKQSKLVLRVNAGYLNQGKGSLEMDVDNTVAPPSVQLTTTFEQLRGTPAKPAHPKSGFASLQSAGNSIAELAGNLNGQVFVELGEGPFNYANFTLLNADVATKALTTLIPLAEKTEPKLECGVSMASFEDGKGITPYGYAARTNEANLIGRIEVDFKREMVQLRFDSRSREGVGLSVGSVFSNTVQIKGPLTDPHIVPNATGLLWRGWAAFMTAGLSVVGESVLKRALSSENPCEAIKKKIQKDICTTDQPLASSTLACPQTQASRR